MNLTKAVSTVVGVVIKDNRSKTITVRVDRTLKHPVYDKVIHLRTKFHVHDEQGLAKVGDQVRIKQSRPYSKTKTWELVEVCT